MVAHKVKKAMHHCIELGEVYTPREKWNEKVRTWNTQWILSHSS